MTDVRCESAHKDGQRSSVNYSVTLYQFNLLNGLFLLVFQQAVGFDPDGQGNDPGNGEQGRNIVLLMKIKNGTRCADGYNNEQVNKGRNRFHFVQFRVCKEINYGLIGGDQELGT